MELVKKTSDYQIFKKRSGRYCVQNDKKTWLHGDDKVKILVTHKLIKAAMPKAKEEPKEEPKQEAVEAKADATDAKPEAAEAPEAKPEAVEAEAEK